MAEKIFEEQKYELCGFIDDKDVMLPKFIKDKGYGILGDDSTLDEYSTETYFHLALGADFLSVRQQLIQRIQKLNLKTTSIIHSSAYIAESVITSQSMAVLVNAVVHTNVQIGDFSCINTGAIVEHDCKIGNNVFIQPRAVLAGNVSVEDNSVIGVGASIRNGIKIGSNCEIGGGSFVCKDIPDNTVAYGVPAKLVKRK